MPYLAHELNLRVLGIEGVEKAVAEFFSEQQLPYSVTKVDGLPVYSALDGRLRVVQANLFDPRLRSAAVQRQLFEEEAPGQHRFVYDRASIVAVDPADRATYLRSVASLAGPGARWLMATLEYDQSEMSGPPFSVPEADIRTLLQREVRPASVELLEDEDAMNDRARHTWGLTALRQKLLSISISP